MLAQSSQLAQVRPSVSTPVAAYEASVDTEITLILICNTEDSDRVFSIYHDDDGNTFNDGTALYRGLTIAANNTYVIELPSPGAGISVARGGILAVQAHSPSSLTFSVYGTTTNITGQID